MELLFIVADLLLALGACLRLTRFVVADDVPGQWFIKDPLTRRATNASEWERYNALVEERTRLIRTGVPAINLEVPVPPETHELPRWARYLEGLSCPYCVSVWMSAFVVLTLILAGGPGDAAHWWRYVAGFLTLAWLTGHIASRVGDTEE
jgi:hypothetical protein